MATNIYLKIGPTKKSLGEIFTGNSQDVKHMGQIEIASWSHSFEQPISAATKSSELGPQARCNHNPIGFEKYYDNSTDDLMKACWTGQCLDALFTMYRPLGKEGGGGELTEKTNRYLAIALETCFIQDMSISGEEELPKESLNLVYNYIIYAFNEVNLDTGILKTESRKIDWHWTTNIVGAEGADAAAFLDQH